LISSNFINENGVVMLIVISTVNVIVIDAFSVIVILSQIFFVYVLTPSSKTVV